MAKKVARTRNAGTWTEAMYWSHVRSALRSAFRYWKPIKNAKMKARREYHGKNKRQKYEYQCAMCGKWFSDKEVEVDHIIPVGSLRSEDDLIKFVRNLTQEDGFQVLDKECHREKTNKERNK